MIHRFLVAVLLTTTIAAEAQTVSTSNQLGATGNAAVLSTASANHKLVVSGAVKQYGTGLNAVGSPTLFLHNTTATTGRQFGINVSNTGLFQVFDVNATNAIRFAIDKSGNIGIGTVAPSAQLHTTGSVRFAGLQINATAPRLLAMDANGNLSYRDASGFGSNSWVTTGTAISNGNTGVVLIGGTVNPATSDANLKLAVKGNVYAQKLKVTQTGWAAYVFDTGYQLPGITEVATFIKINKRLPELPSASEVEKNGIDVGDNQVLLLKKIEELTLYLIKEHEEVEKLKAQNKQILSLLANSAAIIR